MAGYYDLILGLIPLTLFGVTGGLTFGGITMIGAVTVASVVACGLVGHALFVKAPTDRPIA